MSEKKIATEVNVEGNWGFGPDGDVLPIDDFTDFEIKPHERYVSFEDRNTELVNLARAVGGINQVAGALKSNDQDNLSKFKNERTAERILSKRIKESRALGRLACDLCPIADECNIDQLTLRKELKNPKTRRRFTDRLVRKKGKYALCEENLEGEK